MDIHLLLTVSEDPSALHGIRFVSAFFESKEGIRLTLFYTAPQPSAVWADELNYESLSQSEQQSLTIERKGRQALNQAQSKLHASGFPKERMDTKLVFRKNTKATDILQEAEKGLYDSVVLGRRGLSRLEESLVDKSVTRKLLCQPSSAPLWICRKPDVSRKNAVVCVDGSEPAYRMVDHLGYVLAHEKRHDITLLCVRKPGEGKGMSVEKVFDHSKRLLQENNYPLEKVRTEVLDAKDIAGAVLQFVDTKRFAVVGVGRSGTGGCSIRDIFFGSVSYSLFREITGASLWVCQ